LEEDRLDELDAVPRPRHGQLRETGEALRRALGQVEDTIRSEAREVAYVLDVDGTVVHRQTGTRDTVDLPPGILRGRIVTHNHPHGTSLSVQDVRTLIETGAAQVRVVTEQFDYSLQVPPETEWDEVELLIEDVLKRVRRELVQASRAGEISPDEAEVRLLHQVWAEVASIRGWTYEQKDRFRGAP
jgi:hypothetical protein